MLLLTLAGRPARPDPFCRQSDEIVLKIFGFLSKSQLVRCARVCRRWRQLAFDETLWRRMDAAGHTVPAGGLGRLVQRGVRLLRLTRAEVGGQRHPWTPTGYSSITGHHRGTGGTAGQGTKKD